MLSELTSVRHQNASGLGLSLLVMVIITGAFLFYRVNSAIVYNSSYISPTAPASGSRPLVSRVLYIIVDGLRDDVSHTMHSMEALRAHGSWGQSVIVTPSLSQPSWSTLISGATPEISGSSLINAPYTRIRTLPVDTLFDVAQSSHLHTSIVGQLWWKRLLRPGSLSKSDYVPGFQDEDDERIYHFAQSILPHQPDGLILVYFGSYDEMSHQFGALSKPALRSAAKIDRFIEDLAREADVPGTCVVITADHGHIDVGGHGGTEYMVTHPPVVFAGSGTAQGHHPLLCEEDIAPTIAALLGTSIPNSNMGIVRSDYIVLPPEEARQVERNECAQYACMTESYIASLGSDKEGMLPAFLQQNAFTLLNTRLRALEPDAIHKLRVRIAKARASASGWSRLRHIVISMTVAAFFSLWFLRFTPLGVAAGLNRRLAIGGLASIGSHGLLALFGGNTSTSLLSRSGQPGLIVVGIICSTVLPAIFIIIMSKSALKVEPRPEAEHDAPPQLHWNTKQNSAFATLATWCCLLLYPWAVAYALSANLRGYPATGMDIESFQNVALLQVVTASLLSLAVILHKRKSRLIR